MLEDWPGMVYPAIVATNHSILAARKQFQCTPDFVLVNYYNGHDLQDCETGAPISTTFLWRLLFDYFLRGIASFGPFMQRMMKSGITPTIEVALGLIVASQRESGATITEECPLCLFLGIDEYQAVNKLRMEKCRTPDS